jgi:integrase
MRINLKGLNCITKKLADGTRRTYWYAWKGGPPLRGEPGAPEFMASYNEAVAKKVTPPDGVLVTLLRTYQTSDNFLRLRDRTRHDYLQQINRIENDFGDFPLAALTDRRTRGVFMEWRDKRALTSRRQADYGWQVLALILSWAKERGKITVNPCEKGGRVYRGSRVDKIWTDDDEAAFLRVAPAEMGLSLLLALWTGQRQGDLLRLPWSAYDGMHIRLRQSKTGTPVKFKVGAPLKAALDATPKASPVILTSKTGKPWEGHTFRAAFRKAQAEAGVTGLTFHDLRGTAVTRLAMVDCTVPEIASITGHSLKDVGYILDAHYLHRDPKLADSAITKLEGRTKPHKSLPTGLPTDKAEKTGT